jgi:hypothetical protein
MSLEDGPGARADGLIQRVPPLECLDVSESPGFTSVPLTLAAAQVLLHWLTAVPDDVIRVTHPAERQALADLLSALEGTVTEADATALEQAREQLTRASGDWIRQGPTYHEESER